MWEYDIKIVGWIKTEFLSCLEENLLATLSCLFFSNLDEQKCSGNFTKVFYQILRPSAGAAGAKTLEGGHQQAAKKGESL